MHSVAETIDYQSCMQQAAGAYLSRHGAQHLVDQDQLFNNCVRHLSVALGVREALAQKLTHYAWSEHPAAPSR